MVDFRHKNTKKRAKIFYGLAILFLLFLPFLIPYRALGSQILIFMLFAMGYDICLGYAGMLSFGHAAFFGMGAYTTGLLILHYHTNILLAIFAGILFSVLLAFPIGYTAIRRRGIYFAMVTLAYAQMFYFIAFKWTALTGGDDGLQGIPRPDFFGISLQSETSVYYFILGFLLIAILFAFRVVHSPFGHALVSIRESEQRAQSIGFNPARFKLIAFVISAGLCGLAGSLYCILQNFVPLQTLHWSISGDIVMMTILGGMGTLVGPLFGAMFVVLFREVLSTYTHLWALIMGISFIVIVLVFRKGVIGELKKRAVI
ncbi:MAG: branched-chain amino acid ABC transporter permease [Desulfobulbaceae bacterium]|nr:branched-chain amino acid ABC transporter permease [Desulfobulbaceae bacterium]